MLPEGIYEGVMQDSHQEVSSRDGVMLLDMRGGLIPTGADLEIMKIEPQDLCDQEMTVFHHLPQHPHLLQQQTTCHPVKSPPATPPRIKIRPPGELLRTEPKRRPLQYSDLPYMGEMTLDSSKPRRGRKPKKADICHLIYKNYGTTVSDNTVAPNMEAPNMAEIDKVGSLLEQRLMQDETQPLNLCVRDTPQIPTEQDQMLCYPMALYYQNLMAAAAAAATPPLTVDNAPVSTPREKTQAKRKRSAIFIPPAPVEGTTNPATEVSICKFKFTGGAKPSLQEKKMLSVDSGGNFRYYSGTGDKSMRGYEFFPRESLQTKPDQVIPEQVPEQKSSSLEHRRKRKSRRSLQREKLEQTFKEKGFLIQTQKLESAEGATYCKFRQLRKFTRYLFRSWKDYLPGELQNGEGAPPAGVPMETTITAAGTDL